MNPSVRQSNVSAPKQPRPVVFPPMLLDPSATTVTALRQVVDSCLRNIRANLQAALAGSGVEAIHQLRLAVRRLRVVVSVFRKAVVDDERLFLASELRCFQRQLGPAREWDVSVEEILDPLATCQPPMKGLGTVLQLANVHREAAYLQANDAMKSGRVRTLLDRLELWRKSLDPLTGTEARTEAQRYRADGMQKHMTKPAMRLARKALCTQLARTEKLGEDILDMDDTELHALRIQLRKLRYMAELFHGMWHGKKSRQEINRDLDRLKRLQSVLGEAHDASVTLQLLETLRLEAGPEHETELDEVLARISLLHKSDRNHLSRQWRQFSRTTMFWEEK